MEATDFLRPETEAMAGSGGLELASEGSEEEGVETGFDRRHNRLTIRTSGPNSASNSAVHEDSVPSVLSLVLPSPFRPAINQIRDGTSFQPLSLLCSLPLLALPPATVAS